MHDTAQLLVAKVQLIWRQQEVHTFNMHMQVAAKSRQQLQKKHDADIAGVKATVSSVAQVW